MLASPMLVDDMVSVPLVAWKMPLPKLVACRVPEPVYPPMLKVKLIVGSFPPVRVRVGNGPTVVPAGAANAALGSVMAAASTRLAKIRLLRPNLMVLRRMKPAKWPRVFAGEGELQIVTVISPISISLGHPSCRTAG